MTREIFDHRAPGDLPQNQLRIRAIDDKGPGGANCHYLIDTARDEIARVKFQKGNPADGVNGVTHEALLAILIDRLDHFQRGPFPSDHNGEAMHHLRVALMHLHNRTLDRLERGVEGETAA